MSQIASYKISPHYLGKSWIKPKLPRKSHDWTVHYGKSVAKDSVKREDLVRTLSELNQKKAWQWPDKPHFFFSDLHGDPEAFAASLVASGGVRKTGPEPLDFELTDLGRTANFIIGGDCFDKGPSTLGLLRTIQGLKKKGARLWILAGNHDVRVLLGMRTVGLDHTVENEHFFIRTGQKIIPLLKEIWNEYLKGQNALKGIPSKKACHDLLYPRQSWFEKFPERAEGHLPKAQIERELTRIEKKYESFEAKCKKEGLNLRQVYACVQKFKEIFLDKTGEFSWFYKRMRLVYRSGSFLFLHAGLDNTVAKQVSIQGIRALNRTFKKALFGPAFEFYYGPVCNTLRTKYRKVDYPFSKKGTNHVRRAGVSALVHGHRNLYHGQRLALRAGLLNFECDTSLDRHTRKKEGVRGEYGASVTIIDPKGRVLGISSDYPAIKVFDPKRTLKALSQKEKP